MNILINYTNISSLTAKFNVFVPHVSSTNPSIILISETWLDISIPDSIINIHGYTVYRSDRQQNRPGGGVCCYVINELLENFTVTHLNINTGTFIDSIWLKFENSWFAFSICCIYRPGNVDIQADKILFSAISNQYQVLPNLLIFGDFNLPKISWPNMSNNFNPDTTENLFLDLLFDLNLSQLIDKPTRFRQNQNPSILDLILTSDPDLISAINYDSPIGKSDHIMLSANIQVIKYDKSKERYSSFTNFATLSQDIHNFNWQQFSTITDMQEMWNYFITALNGMIETNTKLIKSTQNPLKPWLKGELIKHIQHKRTLWRKYKRSGREEDFDSHRRYSNWIDMTMKQARSNYENALVERPKAFYSYIRQHLSSKVSAPIIQSPDGHMCSSNSESADTLASHFESVYSPETDGPLPAYNGHVNFANISDVEFSVEDVKKILKNLKRDSSPGPDKISPRLVNECADCLCYPVYLLFKNSLASASLPNIWKTSVITPIFKKGDKCQASNYRPISLTSVLCKALERLIVDNILPFLMNNNMIPPFQHGFVPNHSVITNLLASINSWTMALDSGNPTDIIYLDFSKAFDKVPHRRLLLKLKAAGINGKLLQWIENFLCDRTFQVKVGKDVSKSCCAYSGVPQGSVLGPVLFLVYTSDMLYSLDCQTSVYADDTKIFGNPLTESASIQSDLDKIKKWCDDWLIPLNVDKCSILHLGKTNPQFAYNVNGNQLKPVTSQVDLGVTVTYDLSWSEHISNITKKANKIMFLLKKAFTNPTPELAMKLYTTYVRPTIEFAAPVWSPWLIRDKNLLEKIQRSATRWPSTIRKRPYEERLEIMKLTSLEERRLRGDLIQMYRITHGLFPSPEEMAHINTDARLRGHPYKIKKEPFQTSYRMHFITNRTFEAWNKLPMEVVCAPNMCSFKSRLDTM